MGGMVRLRSGMLVRGGKAAPWKLRVPFSVEDGGWLLARITDPAAKADDRTAAFLDYRSAGRAIAYASPRRFCTR